MTGDPDDLLAERAVHGDAAATEALWAAHRRWVAAVLLAHAPAETDLDDLLQEVAVAMVGGLASLREPAALRPWLRTVAVHAARTAGRQHAARARRQRPWPVDPERLCAPPENHADVERLAAVMAEVRALPVELREPLLLRAVDGLSQRRIAAALGVPETTVETRLARARRLLRRGAAADAGRTKRAMP